MFFFLQFLFAARFELSELRGSGIVQFGDGYFLAKHGRGRRRGCLWLCRRGWGEKKDVIVDRIEQGGNIVLVDRIIDIDFVVFYEFLQYIKGNERHGISDSLMVFEHGGDCWNIHSTLLQRIKESLYFRKILSCNRTQRALQSSFEVFLDG